MGDYTARLCASKMAKGIVESPGIVDTYLHTQFHQDAFHAVQMLQLLSLLVVQKGLHLMDLELGEKDMQMVQR